MAQNKDQDQRRMVADVGGTNTRLALFDPVNNELRHTKHFINRDYESFTAIIEAWRESLTEEFPRYACLAIAAVPEADKVTMLNMSWSFSKQETASIFGFKKIRWLNDFAANAYALPHLGNADRQLLYRPLRLGSDNGRLAVMGPGTGLGGATIDISKPFPCTSACEPGHTGLSPANALELELFTELLKTRSHVYAELLLSGPGLLRLYHTLGQICDQPRTAQTPAQVSDGAIAGSDPLAIKSLKVFYALLGATVGDFVLATGSFGAVYLCGGVVSRTLPLLNDSCFHRRFCDKEGVSEHMQSVPIYVITHELPGLLGAANASLAE